MGCKHRRIDQNTLCCFDCGELAANPGKERTGASALPGEGRTGRWVPTFSGGKVWPREPRAEEIRIEDIAHGLSMLCRYTGATRWFYSVAQHSVLVARACRPENKGWGLLHDAAEAYLGDVSAPIRAMFKYCEFDMAELRLLEVIGVKFGLEPGWKNLLPQEVVEADLRIRINEKRLLLNGALSYIEPHELALERLKMGEIEMWSPEVAEGMFMSEFRRIFKDF